MFDGIGPWQIIIVLAIVLLLFGGSKIPEMMRGIGSGVREFKKGLTIEEESERGADAAQEEKKAQS
jgi:sec-independent protein translocase protein TatA